ncbi:hypothetical protein ABFY58_24950 [Enterobacter soli]
MRREQPNQKRVNRQRQAERGPVNNAALERLASVTERVQSRPAPSALEPKSPGEGRGLSLESDHDYRNGKGRGRDSESAEKGAGT